MRPAPFEHATPRPGAAPASEAVPPQHPPHPLPTTGCSGQGAASAIAHWLRQNEERERVMEPLDPPASSASGGP